MVQAAKPDIIYMPNYDTEVALLAKQSRDLGINITIGSGEPGGLGASRLLPLPEHSLCRCHCDCPSAPRKR